MRLVQVDDGELVDVARTSVRSAPERLGPALARVVGWLRGSPRHVALAVVGLLGLVASAVAVPAAVTAWERHEVLRAPAFAGAVLPLAEPPQVRWMTSYDETVRPVSVGDVLVVAGWSRGRRALVGLDVVSGERRWLLPVDARRGVDRVECESLGTAGSVVCAVGAPVRPVPAPDPGGDPAGDPAAEPDAEPGTGLAAGGSGGGAATLADPSDTRSTVLLLDAHDGSVRSAVGLDGVVLALAVSGTDVVLGRVDDSEVVVERLDPVDGTSRWRSVVQVPGSWEPPSGMRVESFGDTVMVRGAGPVGLLDAATGSPVPSDDSHGGADLVHLRVDGSLVRIRYELRADGIDVRSTLVGRDGTVGPQMHGVYAEPGSSDGRSGLVFTASTLAADPLGGYVRAYRAGTAEQVWRAPVRSSAVDADVGGVVVLRGAGAFVGVDGSTGEELWWRPLGLGVLTTYCDGHRLVVVRARPWDGSVVEAIDLRTGVTAWQAGTPPRVGTVLRLGGLLYGSGDGLLVALR